MITAGIIAELNPYHNGHEALIREARRRGAERIVLLMSGDYVQRGTPAIFDRWARAEMVLAGADADPFYGAAALGMNPEQNQQVGADLILSFPTRFATAGAEEFAGAGVSILAGLGCVDTLVCGSESADRERILACAEILAGEPEWYRTALREQLSAGISFARARESVLSEYADLLRAPNDILAVEYGKALIRTGSTMGFECVKRVGVRHSETLPKDEMHAGTGLWNIASASSIREMIRDPELSAEAACAFVPHTSASVLMRELQTSGVMTEDAFSDGLLLKLWETESTSDLSEYKDVTPDLAQTILRERERFRSFSSFSQRITSKSLTRSHANRALLHIALGIRRDDVLDHACCAQVLGMNEKGAELLSLTKKNPCGTVLLVNPARELSVFPDGAACLMKEELRVSNLYGSLRASHNGGPFTQELRHAILRTP